jgi:hypothetical protein
MRWTQRTKNTKREALKTWHDYFAWKPIEVKEGQFVWFEKVLRRAVQVGEYESLGVRRVGKIINSKSLAMRFRWEYTDTLELLKK